MERCKQYSPHPELWAPRRSYSIGIWICAQSTDFHSSNKKKRRKNGKQYHFFCSLLLPELQHWSSQSLALVLGSHRHRHGERRRVSTLCLLRTVKGTNWFMYTMYCLPMAGKSSGEMKRRERWLTDGAQLDEDVAEVVANWNADIHLRMSINFPERRPRATIHVQRRNEDISFSFLSSTRFPSRFLPFAFIFLLGISICCSLVHIFFEAHNAVFYFAFIYFA